MGAFDEQNNRTMTIPESAEQGAKWGWDPHETVTFRVVVTAFDEEWVNNQIIKYLTPTMQSNRMGAKKNTKVDIQSNVGAAKRLWVQRMITDWTLTRGGHKVDISSPVEREKAMKLLPGHYLDRIYDAIMAEQPREEDEEAEQDFTSDASATTEDQGVEEVEVEPIPTPMTASRNYLSKS